MANYNPNDFTWQNQNNSQNYSFDTNTFADTAQTLGKIGLNIAADGN